MNLYEYVQNSPVNWIDPEGFTASCYNVKVNKVRKVKDKEIVTKNLRIEAEIDKQINNLKNELEKLNKINVSQNDIMRIALNIGLKHMLSTKEKYTSYELTKAKSNFVIDEDKMINLFEYLQNNSVRDTKEKFELNRNEYNNYINRLKSLNAVAGNGALKKVKFLISTEELKQRLSK